LITCVMRPLFVAMAGRSRSPAADHRFTCHGKRSLMRGAAGGHNPPITCVVGRTFSRRVRHRNRPSDCQRRTLPHRPERSLKPSRSAYYRMAAFEKVERIRPTLCGQSNGTRVSQRRLRPKNEPNCADAGSGLANAEFAPSLPRHLRMVTLSRMQSPGDSFQSSSQTFI
jgi:hypothetical protein